MDAWFPSALSSVGIIEKDQNNDVLWVWSYPNVTEEQRGVAIRKCGLHSEPTLVVSRIQQTFIFCQYKKLWCYLFTSDVTDVSCLPKVRSFALVLWAKDYNPEKYEALSHILGQAYTGVGSPVVIGRLCLAVMTQGCCSMDENGTFLVRDFDQRHAFANANVQEVINLFKLETILIYTALILKKRVVVYHHKLASLLQFTRALPAFAWHRQDWSILHPFVDLVDEEIIDLKTTDHYVAGFTDAAVETRVDLYDIFINLAAVEITIAPHAKEAFVMSKTHKEIALFMVHCAEDENLSDQQIIKEISTKTKQLLKQLCVLAGTEDETTISLEALHEKKLAPALETFLFNLAVAENMVKVN